MKAKHIILFFSFLLISFNSLMGVILDSYETSTFLLVDLSFCLSAGLVYYLFASDIADGFKIAMLIVLCITGLGRTICMANMSTDLHNSVLFICAVCILFVEIALLFIISYLSNK